MRNHSAYAPHLSNAINSDSIVDMIITVCFQDFHETAPPPSINTTTMGFRVFNIRYPIGITISFKYRGVSCIVQPIFNE